MYPEALVDGLYQVVEKAHEGGLAVQSNWARQMATHVAAAASLGLITTNMPTGFGRVWRPTPSGVRLFYEGDL